MLVWQIDIVAVDVVVSVCVRVCVIVSWLC